MKWLTGWMIVMGLLTAGAEELPALKADYAAKDKALNETYAALKKELRPELFEKLQEDQRSWLKYRDYLSGWQEKEGVPETTLERWEMARDLTAGRIEWLKAWRKLDQRKGWSGSYSDSRGGLLEIAEKDGKCWFTLEVVRGPTFHTGGIAGEVRVNGSTGWFETKADSEEKPTWLTFLDSPDFTGSVKLITENTGYFHGARAYFHGTYVWTGDLSAEEKKKVIEGKVGE